MFILVLYVYDVLFRWSTQPNIIIIIIIILIIMIIMVLW